MDKLVKLFADIGTLWEVYWWKYFEGIGNTLILAVAATLAGCIIGLICGVVNTIPYSRQDNIIKAVITLGCNDRFSLLHKFIYRLAEAFDGILIPGRHRIHVKIPEGGSLHAYRHEQAGRS